MVESPREQKTIENYKLHTDESMGRQGPGAHQYWLAILRIMQTTLQFLHSEIESV